MPETTQELGPLPEPEEAWLPTHIMYYYTADQMRAERERCYALGRAAERERCWAAINALIKHGPLPGKGWDQLSERNGLVLAANAVAALREST